MNNTSNVLDAFDQLIEARINQLGFVQTINAVIKSVKNDSLGAYVIESAQAEGSTRIAYALGTSKYNVNDEVMVIVPSSYIGEWYILGLTRISSEAKEDEKISYEQFFTFGRGYMDMPFSISQSVNEIDAATIPKGSEYGIWLRVDVTAGNLNSKIFFGKTRVGVSDI